MRATYDPNDNKLRLRRSDDEGRMPDEMYAEVRAAGFIWAPLQKLWVAPKWTPERFDLAVRLCGEVGDEDTTLVERAVERAERFEEYSARRESDGDRIASEIGTGPIIVAGQDPHRVAKAADKAKDAQAKMVDMWSTALYWQRRAAGALRLAKYKDKPDVRIRRIKGLEADLRKHRRARDNSEKLRKMWGNLGAMRHRDGTPLARLEAALAISNYFDHTSQCFTLAEYPRSEMCTSNYEGQQSLWSALDKYVITEDQAAHIAIEAHTRTIGYSQRWVEHYEFRIAYEKAMLDEQGVEMPSSKPKKSAKAQLPLLNYRQAKIACVTRWSSAPQELDQIEMTAAEYARIHSDYKGTYVSGGSHRVRVCMRAGAGDGSRMKAVFITDSKVHQRPADVVEDAAKTAAAQDAELKRRMEQPRYVLTPLEEKVYGVKNSAKPEVVAVVAHQLFPTPAYLAEEIAAAALKFHGDAERIRILEPSAGKGNLVTAIQDEIRAQLIQGDVKLRAIDINPDLCRLLRRTFCESSEPPSNLTVEVEQRDFLEVPPEPVYDVIVMNPPFVRGADVRHILHALKFLAIGGTLVAIHARSDNRRVPLTEYFDACRGALQAQWHEIADDAFEDAGTSVRTEYVVVQRVS